MAKKIFQKNNWKKSSFITTKINKTFPNLKMNKMNKMKLAKISLFNKKENSF